MPPSICLIPLAIISSEAVGGEGRGRGGEGRGGEGRGGEGRGGEGRGGEGRGGEACGTHVVVIRQSCTAHVTKYDVIHLEASSTFRSSLAKSSTSGKRFSVVLARKCSRVVFWSADLVELSWRNKERGVDFSISSQLDSARKMCWNWLGPTGKCY